MAVSSTKTRENAEEALRLVDEIAAREKGSRTATLRRLGFSGTMGQELLTGPECTPTMLERVRAEHARVCGASAAAPAAKAGLTVAPIDEDEDSEEEDEAELEDEDDDEDDEEDEDNEGDDRQTHARMPRFGATVPGKGAPLLDEPAPLRIERPLIAARSDLHRAADVIAALGGLDNAERVVDVFRSLKGVL